MKNRVIKFRAWIKYNDFEMGSFIPHTSHELNYSEMIDTHNENGSVVLMQFTGLHDKNGNGDICLYEGDIVSLDGKIIGNIYENEPLLKDKSNIVIKGIGTKDWSSSEKEAMARGFDYPF